MPYSRLRCCILRLCVFPLALVLLVGPWTVSAPSAHAPARLPRGLPVSTCSDRALQATTHFWHIFHGNDYNRLDEVIAELTAAYQEQPNDAINTRLLGMSHMWKFLERGRAGLTAKQVEGNAILSIKYCQEAVALDPSHRLTPGFIEGTKAALGVLQGDAALTEEGFEGIRRNTRQDPNLHGFVQGWVFSALMSERDCRYPEAIEGYFATIDGCAGFRAPRMLPRMGPIMYCYVAFRARKDPVCYNNDIAPHNMEGTILGLGDAYLKQGKIAQARMSYQSVQRAPSYRCWPYQRQLEARLANLEATKCAFRAQTGTLDVSEPAMFFLSTYACTACHAR